MGKLNIVDLAGSETPKRTGGQQKVYEEAVQINNSLLAISTIFNSLSKNPSTVLSASPVLKFLRVRFLLLFIIPVYILYICGMFVAFFKLKS